MSCDLEKNHTSRENVTISLKSTFYRVTET